MVTKKQPAAKNTTPQNKPIAKSADKSKDKSKDKAKFAQKSVTRESKKSKVAGIPDVPPAVSFPIVGVGASAGGLESFEQFFTHVAPDSGVAFVLVQHLDPDHPSLLTEILQRATAMPVTEARDQIAVMPNNVYIIPPNRDMAIFHGTLQLSVPEKPRGQRMPIDAFLRSLAEDQGEKAIGIILSGTGTDGTLGLRAILGAGGVSLVQEPASAKYDGMPASAIGAGYATQVMTPDKMPEALQVVVRRLAVAPRHAASPAAPTEENGINRILMQLRSSTGHDFSLYKKSTIGRRIERRMAQHEIADAGVYARYLKEQPAEMQALFRELLINVTSFFRDPEAFDTLRNDILPQLLAGKPEGYMVRVWVAGCASGEEAYSIAILLRELMDQAQREFKVQIYATDLDEDAIAVARTGSYPPNIAQDITPERLRRFFIKDDAGYHIKKEIREMVVFAIQSVIKDPPFTKLDLLCCRNLMIYLEPELQNRLIPTFHYSLKQGGVLFLSPSESIGNHHELFTPINRKWKIYRATHSLTSTRAILSGALTWAADKHGKASEEVMQNAIETNFAELAKRALLHSYAPASVVTDLKGNIVYVHGETGKFLRPAPGQATLNAIDMAREGLQLELRSAIQRAANQGESTLNRELSFGAKDDLQKVSLSVHALHDAEAGAGLLLVSFQEVQGEAPGKSTGAKGKGAKATPGKRLSKSPGAAHIEELERDLAYTKENLHATIEEQQASNEELKSTNEEMQSTNEELQSTNEELETSKEELQSLNEELITVNTELQSKIEQLAGMQNDMKNLLDNINIGTIFLDLQLNIKRYTREAAQVYRLVASDVGRALNDIKSNIDNGDLLPDAQAVMDDLTTRERQVRTMNGVWYLARMQPYRTLENMIQGVVLTFTDISQRVADEAAVRQERKLAEGIVDTVREPLVVLNASLQVVSASRAFYRNFKVTPEKTVGRLIYELGNRQWDIPALRKLLEQILPHDQSFDDFAVEHDFPVIGHQKMLLNARRIVDSAGGTQMILLAMESVSQAGR
ncbi:MAG TPA: chemotaxis protein CheB [Gallionella sp.]|nr:chemotaxis protein CheB [Gallionella sp.]